MAYPLHGGSPPPGREDGLAVPAAEVTRLSPGGHHHITVPGRYACALSEAVARGDGAPCAILTTPMRMGSGDGASRHVRFHCDSRAKTRHPRPHPFPRLSTPHVHVPPRRRRGRTGARSCPVPCRTRPAAGAPAAVRAAPRAGSLPPWAPRAPSRVRTPAFTHRWLKVRTRRSVTRRCPRLLNTSWLPRSQHCSGRCPPPPCRLPGCLPAPAPPRGRRCVAGERRRCAQRLWRPPPPAALPQGGLAAPVEPGRAAHLPGPAPGLGMSVRRTGWGTSVPARQAARRVGPWVSSLRSQAVHGPPVDSWGALGASDLVACAPRVPASTPAPEAPSLSPGAASPRVPGTASPPVPQGPLPRPHGGRPPLDPTRPRLSLQPRSGPRSGLRPTRVAAWPDL